MPFDGVAPAATDGVRVVISAGDDLQWMVLGEGRRYHVASDPLPWYAPAIEGRWIAWVERGPDGSEDVWLYDLEARETRVVAAGPEHERHVAIQGGYLGWIAESEVVVIDLETGARRSWPADAHTSRGLSLWGEVACWEAWSGRDIDVVCSDGLRVGGPGHQRNPSRWGPWLLYVQDGKTRLARARDREDEAGPG